MKPVPLIVGAIGLIFLVFVLPATWNYYAHAAELNRTLDATTAYYRKLGDIHAKALVDVAAGTEPDATDTQNLLAAFAALGRAQSAPQKWQAVGALQMRLGTFYEADAKHAPAVTAQEHFTVLNQEVTGRGGASGLVHEYNKAASAVHADMQLFPGNVLGWLSFGQPPPFLFLDGKTREIQLFL